MLMVDQLKILHVERGKQEGILEGLQKGKLQTAQSVIFLRFMLTWRITVGIIMVKEGGLSC